MRIHQADISKSLRQFEPALRKKFQLEKYIRITQPAIFYGCLSAHTARKIINHKTTAVVCWRGTDAQNLAKARQGLLKDRKLAEVLVRMVDCDHIKHVAISEFIEKDLQIAGVPYKSVPVTTLDPNKCRPLPRGDCLYSYGHRRRPHIYNAALVEAVFQEFPSEYCLYGELGSKNTRMHQDMFKVYIQVAVGLRLTQHDGLPNTVLELGLMGRPCIYNGKLPNAIPWRNKKHIIQICRQQQQRRGEIDADIAEAVREYITIKDDWLRTEFYE